MTRTPRSTALAALFLCLFSLAASAQPEKELDTPAGWAYQYGATTSVINGWDAQGLRVFQVNRVGTSNTYDAVAVANSGPYAAPGTTILYNTSPSAITLYLSANNRRLVNIDMHVIDGVVTATVVTVPNSGATAAPGWQWFFGYTREQLEDWIEANPSHRLIDIEVYWDISPSVDRRYAFVTVPNTGANFRAWDLKFFLSDLDVNTFFNTGEWLPLDIDYQVGFVALYIERPEGVSSWFGVNKTFEEVNFALQQYGGRLTSLNRYNFGGVWRYAYVIIDNTPPSESTRIRDIMASRRAGGVFGFKAQRLGGTAHAAWFNAYTFEPASTIKILHAAAQTKRFADGIDNLGTGFLNYRDPCDPDDCPDTNSCFTGPPGRTLSHILRRMMRLSDNTATRFFRDRIGQANLNTFAQQQGMTNTVLTGTLGCGPVPHNATTADDLVRLYDRIANGSIFNRDWMDVLFNEHMYNWPGDRFDKDDPFFRFREIIIEEMNNSDLAPNEREAFLSTVRLATKGGSYNWGSLRWRSVAGWAYIPTRIVFLGNIVNVSREYGYAMYYDSATVTSGANWVGYDSYELLRQPIREAVQSWDAICTAPTITMQPQNVTVPEGQPATLSLTAGGSTLQRTFRWERFNNFTNMWVIVQNQPGVYSGATTATLQIASVNASTLGFYRGVVTNYCGSITSATVTVLPGASCPGDTNGDGVVDFTDFSTVLSQYGMTGPGLSGDLNNDGVVDFTDFSIVLANYGTTCS